MRNGYAPKFMTPLQKPYLISDPYAENLPMQKSAAHVWL